MRPAMIAAAVAVLLAPAPVSAPTAAAAPTGFPDLGAYAPVDPHGFLYQRYRGGESVDMSTAETAETAEVAAETMAAFATADGVACFWRYIAVSAAGRGLHAGITCSGEIPGVPDEIPESDGLGCAKVAWSESASGFSFDRHGGSCPPFPSGWRTLDVGQKLVTGNAACVAGADRLVACIDPQNNQGFVLQPAGSWVF